MRISDAEATALVDARPSPLVLASGMLSDDAVWAPQIRSLRQGREVSVAHYGAAARCEGMAAALLESAPSRFALAGHSMGARVALEVVRLAADRVVGLCLISADYRPKPRDPQGEAESRVRQGLLGLARAQGMEAVATAWTPSLIHLSRRDDRVLSAQLESMVRRQDVATLQRQIEAGEHRPDHADVLASLRVPALLICGVEDGLGRGAVQDDMRSLIPDAELLLIGDCGHLPTLEAAGQVNAAMTRWLRAVDRNQAVEPGSRRQ